MIMAIPTMSGVASEVRLHLPADAGMLCCASPKVQVISHIFTISTVGCQSPRQVLRSSCRRTGRAEGSSGTCALRHAQLSRQNTTYTPHCSRSVLVCRLFGRGNCAKSPKLSLQALDSTRSAQLLSSHVTLGHEVGRTEKQPGKSTTRARKVTSGVLGGKEELEDADARRLLAFTTPQESL